MLTFLLIAFAVVATALVVAALRPGAFRVERSVRIAAPPERIEPLIVDLRRFNVWNPFAKDKPVQITYTGPARGVGAGYDFDGSAATGRGQLVIVDAAPGKIRMRLTMVAPIRCENELDFLLAPAAGGTEVSWAMHGISPFIAKLMGLLADTDRMVGREMETGLAALKAQAESMQFA